MIKKKRQSKTSLSKQQTRAKYICPPELKELIDQVNLLPRAFQLKSLTSEITDRAKLIVEQTGDNSALPSILEVLNFCLKDTTEEFQRHIENVAASRAHSFPDSDTRTASVYNVHAKANEYCRLYDLRMAMWHLADRLERERRGEIDPRFWIDFPITASATIFRGDDGKLQKSDLLGLIGKFDDSRLRICEICQRIYWAKRENSRTCSPRCLSVLHTRNSRALTEKEKAEKKAQREANKRQNKKLKELKERKNGTL